MQIKNISLLSILVIAFLTVMALGADEPGSIVGWGGDDDDLHEIPAPNNNFVRIAALAGNCLGLKSDGSIVAWGNKPYDLCNIPEPNTGFTAIAGGCRHALAIKTDGSITTWGWNASGQCDVPSPNTDFIAVAAGEFHSLGLKTDGSIVAWGGKANGQCDIPSPNTGFVAIAAGYRHSLGLKADGSIITWGYNIYGQCDIPSPNTGFVAVASGYFHSLGLKADGSIVAWGQNNDGQCDVPSPNTGFVAIAGGFRHSVGLKADGSIVAWGHNWDGQCEVPTPNTGFTAIATKYVFNIGLKGGIIETGSLRVTIVPQEAIEAGAKWRRVGTTSWNNSGYIETNIPVGECVIEFKDIPGFITPSNQFATVTYGERKDCVGIYGEVLITVSCDDPDQHEIDPNIYGLCHADRAMLEELNVKLNRYGGNHSSTYNWRENAYNTGIDYFFESLPYSSSEPGGFVDRFISDCLSTRADTMVTVPMIGWVAKLGPDRLPLASYPKSVYPSQEEFDKYWPGDPNYAGNGTSPDGKPIYGNPQLAYVPSASSYQLWGMIMSPDTVFQNEWIVHITTKWGLSDEGGVHYYILDNEPSLWHKTHRDTCRVGITMDELARIMIEYAGVIKDIDPQAQIVGPELWGWTAYFLSGFDQQYGDSQGWTINWDKLPDRSAHNQDVIIPWLLKEFKTAENEKGYRLLDVLSVHQYPNGGEFNHDGGDDDVSRTMQLLRNRSTRRLWDDDYIDESWINEPVRLIPRLQEWVDDYYKGTKIAITEYNWGAVEHMNGATAQADILGIFGRYGIDMATHWKWPKLNTDDPVYQVFKLYRNYDGAGSETSAFGEISIPVSVPDPDGVKKDYRDYVSAYAAKRSVDNALTLIVINKDIDKDISVVVDVSSFVDMAVAQVWRLREPERIILKSDDIEIYSGSLQSILPKQSVTLFVIKKSDSTLEFNSQ